MDRVRLLRMVIGPLPKENIEVIKSIFEIQELIIRPSLPLQIIMMKDGEKENLRRKMEDIDMIEINGGLSSVEEEFMFEIARDKIIIQQIHSDFEGKVINYRRVEIKGKPLFMPEY
jgi:hypothetical protein